MQDFALIVARMRTGTSVMNLCVYLASVATVNLRRRDLAAFVLPVVRLSKPLHCERLLLQLSLSLLLRHTMQCALNFGSG